MKIVSNLTYFLNLVKKIIRDFERTDMYEAGLGIGTLLYKLFIESTSEQGNDPVTDFLKGFLEGLNEKGDVEDLLKCVKNAEKIINEIIDAIKIIAKGDIGHIIEGITKLLAALNELL